MYSPSFFDSIYCNSCVEGVMTDNDVQPHDKFIDRWARIFLKITREEGSVAAEEWARRSLNVRDYPRLQQRISELRGISPI